MDVTAYEHVKFRPWIGPDYREGEGVMVLGESHYDTGEEPSSFTETVVGRYVRGDTKGWKTRIFTKTARLFLMDAVGERASLDTCHKFWNGVMFYNYIQEYVGPKSRIAPAEHMWQEAVCPFKEIVARHRPRLVLMLGQRLASHFDPCHKKAHPEIVFVEIHHPQGRGWRYADWVPPLRSAVEKARIFPAKDQDLQREL